MPPTTYFQVAKNALNRADEFLNIGNKEGALEVLEGFIGSRLFRSWQKDHERIMDKFFEICVDLRKNVNAKEALYELRKAAINDFPSSMEVVVQRFIAIAEERVEIASKACEEQEEAEEDSPEAWMLQSVTTSSVKERTEHANLVPWLRFLWEVYRMILDVLRSAPKLQELYHETCKRAFEFCVEHKRTMEAKRLCELLRHHMMISRRQADEGDREWEQTDLEKHLMSRFEALKATTALELWNEGFRMVEEIHDVMRMLHTTPKASLMASYFERLTKIFWAAGNHRFHAFILFELFTLVRARNKAMSAEDLSNLAAEVVLAAVSIPLGVHPRAAPLVEEKAKRIANLLGYVTAPTRQTLLKDLVSTGVLKLAPQPIQDVYRMLVDGNVHALMLVDMMLPRLKWIGENEALKKFLPVLERQTVFSVLRALPDVFNVMTLTSLESLVTKLSTVDRSDVELLLLEAADERDTSLCIDHTTGMLKFHSVDRQALSLTASLKLLATRMAGVVEKINGNAEKEARCASIFEMARESTYRARREHGERLRLVEKQKRHFEEIAAARREEDDIIERQRARDEEERRKIIRQRERESMQRLMEEGRLVREQKKEEEEAMMKKQEREAPVPVKPKVVDEMKLLQDQERKDKEEARRMNALVKALREKEAPRWAAKPNKDQAELDRMLQEVLSRAQEDHAKKIAMKQRLASIRPLLDRFADEARARWAAKGGM